MVSKDGFLYVILKSTCSKEETLMIPLENGLERRKKSILFISGGCGGLARKVKN